MVIYKPRALDSLYSALANETRRTIVTTLAAQTRTVLELTSMFEMSQPAVTKHLNVLEEAGLITRKKVGRYRQCDIVPETLDAASAWIERCRSHWEESFSGLEKYLEEKEQK